MNFTDLEKQNITDTFSNLRKITHTVNERLEKTKDYDYDLYFKIDQWSKIIGIISSILMLVLMFYLATRK